MGVITDQAKVVYDKGPTTDPTNPDKDQIVGLFSTVENQVAGAAAGLVRTATLSALNAIPGTRTGQPGEVTNNGSNTGAYSWSGSAWVRVGDIIDPAAVAADIDALQTGKADATDLDKVRQKASIDVVAATSSSFATSPETAVAIRLGNFPWAPSDFTGWLYAWLPSEPMVLDSIEPLISVGAGTVSFDLKVWQRQPADIASAAAVGTLTGDVLIYTRSVLAAEFADAMSGFAYVPLDISGAGTAYPGYLYAVDLTARISGGGLGQIASGALSYTGTHPQWERGWYRNAAGGLTVVPSTQRVVFRLNDLTVKQPDNIQAQIDAIAENFIERTDSPALDTGVGSRFTLANNFRGCQIGVNFDRKVTAKKAVLAFRVASDAAYIYARIYKRSASFIGSAAYGTDAGDVVVFDKTIALADVGLSPDTDNQFLSLDLSDFPALLPEYQYGFEFSAKTAIFGSTLIAMASVVRISTDPQWQKGYYSTATTSPPSWTAFSSTSGLSFRLEALGYDFVSSTSQSGVIAPQTLSSDQNVRSELDFALTIPALSVLRPSGTINVPQTDVTFDAPVSTGRTGSMSLVLMLSSAIVPNLPTKDQYISNVTLTRVSDGATLVAGTDYSILPDQGAVGLIVDGAAVTVTYVATAHAQRYDLVSLNPATKAIVVTKGTDRYSRDPDYYKPLLPAGNIALYSAFVTWHGVDLIPIMHHRHYVRDDRKADVAIWKDYNRSCLSNTFKALRAGAALKILGYGDSITAIGGGTVEPDGSARDLASYIVDMPDDTKATIPVFDGPAGVGAHVHISWNWVLKAALEKRYSSTITYLNFGIGGTTSNNDNPDGSHPGGLWPARINRILTEGPALMVLAFGMNELGSSTTYGNTVSIIQQAKAVGMEVIVITPPRCNDIGRGGAFIAWKKTHDDLILAALDTGSAYLSTYEIAGTGFEGSVGRSPKNMCTMNLYNHPWPAELADYGAFLSSIFD